MDIERPDELVAYLRASGRLDPGEEPAVRVLAGGVSNRTVLLRRPSGEAWVLKQALAKLRVAIDWFSSPERIHREALGMRVLASLAPPGAITPLLFEDRAHDLLAMRAVPAPHDNWKTLLLDGRVRPDHVRHFGALLGRVHAGAARADAVPEALRDRSFFESLRLEPYYLFAASRCPTAAPFLHALVADTRGVALTLVHGDYSPKNVLVHADALVLLDHEVIHVGDPAFDVGFALAHLLSKAHHVRAGRATFAEAAALFWDTYAAHVRALAWPDLEPRAVRHTLGCLLARIDGRSPLEYLTPAERDAQRAAVLALVARPPSTVRALIPEFLSALEAH